MGQEARRKAAEQEEQEIGAEPKGRKAGRIAEKDAAGCAVWGCLGAAPTSRTQQTRKVGAAGKRCPKMRESKP